MKKPHFGALPSSASFGLFPDGAALDAHDHLFVTERNEDGLVRGHDHPPPRPPPKAAAPSSFMAIEAPPPQAAVSASQPRRCRRQCDGGAVSVSGFPSTQRCSVTEVERPSRSKYGGGGAPCARTKTFPKECQALRGSRSSLDTAALRSHFQRSATATSVLSLPFSNNRSCPCATYRNHSAAA